MLSGRKWERKVTKLDIKNDKEIEAATGVVREKVGEEGKCHGISVLLVIHVLDNFVLKVYFVRHQRSRGGSEGWLTWLEPHLKQNCFIFMENFRKNQEKLMNHHENISV